MDIYIVSTDKSCFDNNTDWVSITENDLCFSGEVTFDVEAWTTITLTNPFFYDGSNNIVIVTYDKSKETLGWLYFSVFEAEKQSLYIQDDGNESQNVFLDPFNPTSFVDDDIYNYHTLIDVKNQIRKHTYDEEDEDPLPHGMKRCEICQNPFVPTHAKQKYCKGCAETANRKKTRTRMYEQRHNS